MSDSEQPPLRNNDAYGAIRGFVFQALVTLERLGRLKQGESLRLEHVEDIDWYQNGRPIAYEQVKYSVRSLTIRTEPCPTVLANAAQLLAHQGSPTIRLTTNARSGEERPAIAAAFPNAIASWVEQQQRRKPSKKFVDAVHNAIRRVNAEHATLPAREALSQLSRASCEKMVRRMRWDCGVGSIRELEGRLRSQFQSQFEPLMWQVLRALSSEGEKWLSPELLEINSHETGQSQALLLEAKTLESAEAEIDWNQNELTNARDRLKSAIRVPQPTLSPAAAERSPPHFLGREPELGELQRWLDQGDRFSWRLLHGEAGVGKTRLVATLLARCSPTWRCGFIGQVQLEEFNWAEWQPIQNTLLVVDYAALCTSQLRRALTRLAERSDLRRDVRVLLLERAPSGSWWMELTHGHRTDARTIASAAAVPLELVGLSPEDRLLFLRAQGVSAGAVSENETETLTQGRPLLLRGLARAVQSGESRETLAQSLLNDVKRYWQVRNDGRSAAEDVLALCTMVRSSTSIEAIAEHRPQHLKTAAATAQLEAARSLVGQGAERLPQMLPHLLGEWFVLEHLQSVATDYGRDAAHALVQAAWNIDPDGTVHFIYRAVWDHSAHKALQFFISKPEREDALHNWLVALESLHAGSVQADLAEKVFEILVSTGVTCWPVHAIRAIAGQGRRARSAEDLSVQLADLWTRAGLLVDRVDKGDAQTLLARELVRLAGACFSGNQVAYLAPLGTPAVEQQPHPYERNFARTNYTVIPSVHSTEWIGQALNMLVRIQPTVPGQWQEILFACHRLIWAATMASTAAGIKVSNSVHEAIAAAGCMVLRMAETSPMGDVRLESPSYQDMLSISWAAFSCGSVDKKRQFGDLILRCIVNFRYGRCLRENVNDVAKSVASWFESSIAAEKMTHALSIEESLERQCVAVVFAHVAAAMAHDSEPGQYRDDVYKLALALAPVQLSSLPEGSRRSIAEFYLHSAIVMLSADDKRVVSEFLSLAITESRRCMTESEWHKYIDCIWSHVSRFAGFAGGDAKEFFLRILKSGLS